MQLKKNPPKQKKNEEKKDQTYNSYLSLYMSLTTIKIVIFAISNHDLIFYVNNI